MFKLLKGLSFFYVSKNWRSESRILSLIEWVRVCVKHFVNIKK